MQGIVANNPCHVLRGTCTSDRHGWRKCKWIAGAILAMCIGREQAAVAQAMASRAGDEGGESGDEVQGLRPVPVPGPDRRQ